MQIPDLRTITATRFCDSGKNGKADWPSRTIAREAARQLSAKQMPTARHLSANKGLAYGH